MKLLDLVKAKCANWTKGGGCMGVDFRKNESSSKIGESDRCRVRDKERCPYFERCVLPMADMTTDKHKKHKLEEARRQYFLHCTDGDEKAVLTAGNRKPEHLTKVCPDCGKSRPKGCSRCKPCAKKMARMKKRQRYARNKSRSGVFTQNSDTKTQ